MIFGRIVQTLDDDGAAKDATPKSIVTFHREKHQENHLSSQIVV
jgi:hypothetical protein